MPKAAIALLHFPPQDVQPPPLPSPSGPIPAPRLAASSPDAMRPPDEPYSLLADMAQTRNASHGPKEKVALYQFPSYISTNIRRVLARSRFGHGDWGLALSCLLWRGLIRFNALPAARALSDLLRELDTDDGLDSIAGEQVEMWRRGFRFSIPDPTHTMGLERCRSWKAPEHVHAELYDLAGRLGLAGAVLGTAAVMAGLEDQPGVLEQHGEHMRGVVAQLDGLLQEREGRLRKLVAAIKAGVWT